VETIILERNSPSTTHVSVNFFSRLDYARPTYTTGDTQRVEGGIRVGKTLIALEAAGSFAIAIDMRISATGGRRVESSPLYSRREVLRKYAPMTRRGSIWDVSLIRSVIRWISRIEDEGLGDEEGYAAEARVGAIKSLFFNVSQGMEHCT
jgi:hypothetical protein